MTRKYILWSLAPMGLLSAGFAVLFVFITHGRWFAAIYAIGAALVVAIPLDKRCDERFRQLKQIDGGNA